MGLFDRFRRKRRHSPVPAPSAQLTRELVAFMRERDGVEAFIEPPTAVWPMSLCLVDGDGDSVRRPVQDEDQARRLCNEQGVPLYDARIVGYPKRMKDFQRGVKGERVSLDEMPPLDVVEDPDTDR
ncbi:MAG TPA: hypothetical protein VNU01_04075 [Egibacteraceae bacterium]|nr:hypothetical protein [Egibacteraceae bacterium]